MAHKDRARRQAETGSRASAEPAARLGPTGFDPAREPEWQSGPCFNRLGHVSSHDICLPAEPGARGVVVVASVFSGPSVAAFIALAPEMFRALELIIDMEPEHTNPEAMWMAGVARAIVSKARTAIAMEAASAGETCNRLHPKDDSAGPQDIAQPSGGDPQ